MLTFLQIALLIVTILLFSWSFFQADHVAVPLIITMVIILQAVGLLAYVESHVDTLEDFFAAVNYEDFTRRFVEDDVDAELKAAFNRIISKFQGARAQRDLQAGYLETVVRHVPVPFMATRADGTLTLINNPAKRILGLPSITNIAQLAELESSLPGRMQKIAAGDQQLLQTRLRGVPAEMRVSVAEIRIDGSVERLYSLENLSGELTAREASAWHNLIRVLTHEIMNTLTPVTSLAQSARSLLGDPSATEDIRDAVKTIAKRSEGLMQFVRRYREILNVPKPVFATVGVSDSLRNVVQLMREELHDVEIAVDVHPESLEISADAALLDNVLLNLVRNAVQAVVDSKRPKITLSGRLSYGRVAISVHDNGSGIAEEAIDQIFVPFFTTRRDGSGVGLSLSRQIMSAHGGEIAAESNESGTTLTLVF